MTLTNDLNFTLSNPCPRGGWLGAQHDCRAKDYRSWRKILIGLRQSLISARCLDTSSEFDIAVCGWLHAYADLELLRPHPTSYGLAMIRVMSQADPTLQFPIWAGLRMDTAALYPADPSIEFHWTSGEGSPAGANYSEITMSLVRFIAEGWELFQQGVDDGEVPVQSSEVTRASRRPAPVNWFPVALVGIGITSFIGLVAYGAAKIVPVYAQYERAKRGK